MLEHQRILNQWSRDVQLKTQNPRTILGFMGSFVSCTSRNGQNRLRHPKIL
jgi:hypothetical protein